MPTWRCPDPVQPSEPPGIECTVGGGLARPACSPRRRCQGLSGTPRRCPAVRARHRGCHRIGSGRSSAVEVDRRNPGGGRSLAGPTAPRTGRSTAQTRAKAGIHKPLVLGDQDSGSSLASLTLRDGAGHCMRRASRRYERMSARCLSGRWLSRSGYSVRPAPRLGSASRGITQDPGALG